MKKVLITIIVLLTIVGISFSAVKLLANTNDNTETIENSIDLDYDCITYSYVAYGNTHFINADHNGKKIKLTKDNEKIEYDKGITFHGYAVIRFDFDYNITNFKSDFGINESDYSANGTSFKIKIIANDKEVYTSSEINRNNRFQHVDINLEATNNIILVLDPMGNNQNDRVSFGNPTVVKGVL